jgi:hypothetical protein
MDDLFQIYVSNLEDGKYKIPIFFDLIQYTNQRYGEQRVSVKTNSYTDCQLVINNFSDRVNFDKLINNASILFPALNSLDLALKSFLLEENFLLQLCGIKNLNLIIHYPHTIITNSNKEKHNLYDIYIDLKFDMDCNLFRGIEFHRSAYTYLELINNYAHSHVPGSYVLDLMNKQNSIYNKPCLGTSQLQSSVANWSINNHSLTIFDYMILLEHLDTFIGWESLEGGPYKKISELKDIKQNNISYRFSNSKEELASIAEELRQILYSIIDDYVSIKICSNIIGIKYKDLIIDMDNLEIRLVNEYLKKFPPPLYLLCNRYKNNRLQNIYYTDMYSLQELKVNPVKVLDFKDNPVYLKLIEGTTEVNKDPVVFIPDILKTFFKELKIIINNEKIKFI